jgi:hypothetical protein
MPKTPELRAARGIRINKRAAIAAARAEREARAFDIFMRTTAVAADPDGEHLWLLLKPKGGQ